MEVTTCNINVTNFATFSTSAFCNLAKVSLLELKEEFVESFEKNIDDLGEEVAVSFKVDFLKIFIQSAKCRYYKSLDIEPEPRLDFARRMTFASVFTILMVISIISNAACGHLAYQYLKIEKTTSYTLMSLAISDLGHTLVLYPLEMNNVLRDMYWQMGRYSCGVLPFLISTTNLSSSFTLCLIALLRCWSVVRSCRCGPQPQNKYSQLCAVATTVCWLVAAGLSSVCLLSYKVQSVIWDDRMLKCANDDLNSRVYNAVPNNTKNGYPTVNVCLYDSSRFKSEVLTKYLLYVLPSFAFIPLFLIIATFYIYLSIFLWSATPVGNSQHADKIRRKYKKVVRTLVGLVALFFVCRCPGMIYGYVVGLNEMKVDSKMLTIRFVLVIFRLVNCILDPLCYGLLQDQFKDNVVRMWKNVQKSFHWKKSLGGDPASNKSLNHSQSVDDSIGTSFLKGHVFMFKSLRKFTPSNLHSRVGAVQRY